MKEAKEICPTTTMGKIKTGALLVDVRSSEEVEQVSFDVEDILCIPLDELEDRIQEIPKEREIIMVCRSGQRSLRTTYFLMNAGYPNVFNMKGGILQWGSKKFATKGDITALLAAAACDCSKPNCC